MMNILTKTCFVFLALGLGVTSAHNHETEADTLSAMVVGSGSPKYNSERAGPAVLIRYADTTLLVDMGNGTQAHLAELGISIKSLDGLLFTHHHLDHNEEFIPIFIRSLLGGNQFHLAGPEPMTAMSKSTLALYKTDIEYRMRRSGRTLSDVVNNYQLSEISDKAAFTIGDIKITTTKVNHTIDTIAYRFEAGGQSVVISGDLSYSKSLSILAKDADVLIIDSGGTIKRNAKPRRQLDSDNEHSGKKRERAHVTLDETAKMASDANVSRVVLTHFTNGENDEAATVDKLRDGYSGEIIFATDRMVVTGEQKILVKQNTPTIKPKTNVFTTLNQTNPCTIIPSLDNDVAISEGGGQRLILANAIPSHKIGTFPNSGNPNTLSAQSKSYRVTLTPKIGEQLTYLYDQAIDYGRPNYLLGVALNGVKFEPMANEYFQGVNGPNYQWTVEALSPFVFLGDDCNNAHIQPNGEYHYHGSPTGLIASLRDEQKADDMMLVGWAADGFPIYYAWGYKKPNSDESQLIKLKPSFELRKGQRPGDGQSAPNGEYSGEYVRDYVYRDNSGDLDQCNGRQGVTPEFPNGTYYYVLTDTFPFAGRCLVGQPGTDFKVGGGKGSKRSGEAKMNNSRDANSINNRNPTQIIQRMDKNNDQRISVDEARGKLKENFQRRDKNRDGYLSFQELSSRR